ncbi:MAG: G8 domain-containing protein [Pseudomonadota bacterium]
MNATKHCTGSARFLLHLPLALGLLVAGADIANASAQHHCDGPVDPTGLVAAADATHIAAASGRWEAPLTWSGGLVPDRDARVLIPESLAVTIDTRLDATLSTVRVDGALRFASDADTALRLDTLVTTCTGLLAIGSADAPVAADRRASITFVDNGPVDGLEDPAQIGRGAVLLGRTEFHGAPRTHRAILDVHPRAGAATIRLKQAPEGWRVGDLLTITGTVAGDPRSDELRQIAAIDGTTISLATPLSLDHVPPASDLNVYVANLTRNIVIASESAEVAHRGHVMFMHTLDVDVRNVAFENLGRTDKRRELDDLFFEFEEDVVGNATSAGVVFEVEEGPRTNIRGRYPVHFHRGGVAPGSTPARISGSVVFDSPGWGFVMHSAHVHMIDNVSYAVQGSGFYTEAGDEIGLLQGNIAVRSANDAFVLDDGGAIDPDLGADQQEFGNDGEGFWLSGHRVALIDNVSAGSTGHGFIYWTDGLVEADIPEPARMSVRVADLPNGDLIPGRESIPTWWAPMAPIRGNEAYGSMIGFRFRYAYSQAYLGEGGSAFHKPPP